MTDTRFRLLIIFIVAGLAAATWSFPTWWPIVNQESAAGERFPGLDEALQPDFVELPDAERNLYFQLYNGDEDEEIDPQPEWSLSLVEARLAREDQFAPGAEQPFEPPAGSRTLVSGTFAPVDAVRFAEGDLTIYQEVNTGQRLLRLDNNFSSSRAEDIHIIFTRNPDPLDERGVGVDFVDVGDLQGNVGGQTYIVPAEVGNFEVYVVLALYSPTYDAVLATATLR